MRLTRSVRRRRVAAVPVSHLDVEHDGVSHRVILRRVASARRYTLRVRAAHGDVVLTMPAGGSLQAARDFALRHAAWVSVRVGRLHRPVPFEPGSIVPVRGVPHRIEMRPGLRRRVWLEAGDTAGCLCVSDPAGRCAAAVTRFLHGEARRDLAQAVDRHATAVRRQTHGLTLRDTKSRWGSCTAAGRLNFSWRLVLAPPFVLDYLAAHEVAHLVHMNHSDAFWALAGRLAPRLAEAEAWLKANGAGLHAYGAVAVTPADRSG